jgi:hypothetical protein
MNTNVLSLNPTESDLYYDPFYVSEGYEGLHDINQILELIDGRIEKALIEFDNLLPRPLHEFTQESFYSSIKEFLTKLIKSIMDFFRWLIDRFKQIIRWIVDFIRDKSYLKAMDDINSLITEDDLTKAYDIYGNTNILDDSIKGVPALTDATLREMQYIKYTSDIFENAFKRISAATAAAIDSISKILSDSLRNNGFLRTGGAVYGNREQEENDKKNDVILEFFQDRNFQSFIYQINRYTDENLNAFIKEINDARGKGLYSRFDYGKFNGTHLALAVILNKKVEDVKYYIENTSSYKANIPINSVISKNLLLEVRNRDKAVIDSIKNDCKNIFDACTSLEKLSERYYNKLQDVSKNLEDPNGSLADGLTSIKESQQWITILISFSNYFFNYKIRLLNVAKRAVYILCKKASISQDGNPKIRINSSIGYFPKIDEAHFYKLTDDKLHAISQHVMRSQISRLGGINKPAHIIIIKGNSSHSSSNQKELANALGLYTNIDDKLLYSIRTKLMSPVRNVIELNRLITNYDRIVDNETYTANDKECKLSEVVIRIYYDDLIKDILNNRIYTDDYLPAYFFGTIIHEATHVKQMCDIEITLKESKDMGTGMTKADEENNKLREKELLRAEARQQKRLIKKIKTIQKMHEDFSYKYSNLENEANSEEIKFIMSVVESTCNDTEIISDIRKDILNS